MREETTTMTPTTPAGPARRPPPQHQQQQSPQGTRPPAPTRISAAASKVRRERISERMRYLQELLPGCDKVTGKARMLDEIINYVQSMQKQVEMQQPVAGFGMAMLVSSPYIAAQSAPQSAAATSVSASPAASVELGLDANGAVTWDIASQHLLSGFDAKF